MRTVESRTGGLPAGVLAIAGLFGVGVLASGASALALLFPHSIVANIWRLNPQARPALSALGVPGILLMVAVLIACAMACIGLLRRRPWGYQAALAILAVNVLSDAVNAGVRGDLRTLIGVPIGIALIVYLRRKRVALLYAHGTNEA
jgi:hypothetical protein